MVDTYALTQELNHKKEEVDQLTSRVAALEVDEMYVSDVQKELQESKHIQQQQYQQLLLLSSKPSQTESSSDESCKVTPSAGFEAQMQMKRMQADQQRLVKDMVTVKNSNEMLKKQLEEEYVQMWRVI